MACGKVQFQTDLSEANFDELCGATARRHTEPAREGCELPGVVATAFARSRAAHVRYSYAARRKQTSVKGGASFGI